MTKLKNNFSHGIIFDITVNKVILTNTDHIYHASVYSRISKDSETNTLSNYCNKNLDIDILPNEWSKVCTLTNLKQSWNIHVFLTVQDFDKINIKDNSKIITIDIEELKKFKCANYTSWLLPLCKDCRVDGNLTKIICNANNVKEYTC